MTDDFKKQLGLGSADLDDNVNEFLAAFPFRTGQEEDPGEDLSEAFPNKNIFFSPNISKTVFFAFVNYGGLGEPTEVTSFGNGHSFFSSWLSLLPAISDNIPLMEDRNAIARRDLPEIDGRLLRSCLAYAVERSFVFRGLILIENMPSFSQMIIRFHSYRPAIQESKDLVRSLLSFKEVRSNFRPILTSAIAKGRISIETTSDRMTCLKIFYSTKHVHNYGKIKNQQLTLSERQAYLLAQERGGRINREALMRSTGLSPRTASYVLMSLDSKKLLKRQGKIQSKTSYYSIVK